MTSIASPHPARWRSPAIPDLDVQLAIFRSTHRPIRATLGGTEWSYIVGGSGKATLLLLPGAPGIAEMAFPYIAAFERRYRVIAPSYPATVGSLTQLLAGIAELVATEARGPIHLIGASYSGLVAQYLIERHSDRFASLLIGDTGVPRAARARALRLATGVIGRLSNSGFRSALSLILAYVLKGDTSAHRFWQRYLSGVVANLSVVEFVNRVQVMMDMDRQGREICPPLAWYRPTLLMETVADPLFSPAERADLRARYPQAELHTFYSRGHITALTRAPEYIAVMEEFLARQM